VRPLAVANARREAPFKDLAVTADLNIGSYLGVPIVLGTGEVYGTLCAIDPEEHVFSDDQVRLLVLLARLVAFQIDRDEFEQRLRASEARAVELASVAERMATIGRLVASSLDPERVAKAAINTAISLTGADRAAVALPGDDGMLRHQFVGGESPEIARQYVFAPGEGYIGRTFAECSPYLVDDLEGDSGSHQAELDSQLRIRSLISVPLVASGGCLGVLAASSYRVGAFTEEHQDLLERLADHTAIALRRAEQHRVAVEAQGQFRGVLDATGEGIALVAPDHRFLAINRAFSEIFGFSADYVVGRRFDEFRREIVRTFEDPVGFSRLVTGSATDRTSTFTGSFALRGPGNREVELYSAPVHSADGAHLGRLFVYRDVTREREVDRMKSEFVSLVSHELRTPLTSIKGYVDLLVEGEAGAITPDQAEFLGVVRANADRLVALVNDLLDVSRMEAGKIHLDCAPVDVVGLARGVADTLRPQIESKRQRLVLDLPNAPIVISADQNRLVQVLTNLLSNAHKYTPSGGDIGLVVARDEGVIRLAVRDTGIGMATEEQAQLFTKFFRARNRVAREAGGTGLGLVITKSLVTLHGGDISVHSTPGEGSTFVVTLPLDPTVAA
jgi:PAS domain S-box-containing protein